MMEGSEAAPGSEGGESTAGTSGSGYAMVKLAASGNPRPYRCDVCQRSFREMATLRKHEQLHRADRPYACTTCGKSFLWSSNLKVHERVHTGERPYKCKICYRSFTQSNDLRRHERNVHYRNKVNAKHMGRGQGQMSMAQYQAIALHQQQRYIQQLQFGFPHHGPPMFPGPAGFGNQAPLPLPPHTSTSATVTSQSLGQPLSTLSQAPSMGQPPSSLAQPSSSLMGQVSSLGPNPEEGNIKLEQVSPASTPGSLDRSPEKRSVSAPAVDLRGPRPPYHHSLPPALLPRAHTSPPPPPLMTPHMDYALQADPRRKLLAPTSLADSYRAAAMGYAISGRVESSGEPGRGERDYLDNHHKSAMEGVQHEAHTRSLHYRHQAAEAARDDETGNYSPHRSSDNEVAPQDVLETVMDLSMNKKQRSMNGIGENGDAARLEALQERGRRNSSRSSESSIARVGTTDGRDGSYFQCELCNVFFDDNTMYNLHRSLHSPFSGQPFTCPTCKRICEDRVEFMFHNVWHAKYPHSIPSYDPVDPLKI